MNNSFQNNASNKRYYSIDIVKGVLIILVIIGHVLPGSIEGNPLRYFIYSFHMPVFIGVSGYLLNYQSLINIGFFGILQKYKNRIIIPWITALSVYFVFHEVQRSEVNIINDILDELFFPFYHLWFIPGFLTWVILARWIGRSEYFSNYFLFTAAILSFVTYVISKNIYTIDFIHQYKNSIRFMDETIRPYYFIFFVFGIKFKEIMAWFDGLGRRIIFTFLLIGLLMFNLSSVDVLKSILYYFFNFVLISWILYNIERGYFPSVYWIEWLGINSMGIYLWHVMPIIIIKYFFNFTDMLVYYSLMALALAGFFVAYFFLNRFKLFRRVLFGLS